jgi:hypothetical protein
VGISQLGTATLPRLPDDPGKAVSAIFTREG